MDSQFLRSYFLNGDAGHDRIHRPETFRERVAQALTDEGLARELAGNSTFAQAVASQFGIAAYRKLKDRDINKSAAIVAAENNLRAQGRQPYSESTFAGKHPGNQFPRESLHRVKPVTAPPPAPDVKASDTLRVLAGLPEGATVNEAIEALAKP